MAITCPTCGKELPDDAKFCGECGTLVFVQEKKPDYCINCFAELPENTKFCLQCGKQAVIATSYHSLLKKDESIHEELRNTSPQQVKYQQYKARHKAWEKTPLEYKEPELDLNDIVGFEQNEAEAYLRARKWADYEASGKERIHWFQELAMNSLRWEVNSAWSSESSQFRTNKPNHHKALFYKVFIEDCLFHLRQQLALTYDEPPKPSPMFLEYLRKVRGYTDEDMAEFELELPDMEEIKQWPQKDDELFPPPQPVELEAAAGIVHFTTDEAVVFVYLDCIYKGKEIELDSVRDEELSLTWQKATIIERTYNNAPICVAIFDPIPFTTDEMKNREKAVNQVKVEVRASWGAGDEEISQDERRKLSGENKTMRFNSREEIILFKGNVTQIDWRGRRAKVERMYDR